MRTIRPERRRVGASSSTSKSSTTPSGGTRLWDTYPQPSTNRPDKLGLAVALSGTQQAHMPSGSDMETHPSVFSASHAFFRHQLPSSVVEGVGGERMRRPHTR